MGLWRADGKMVWWHIGDVTGEELEIPGCRLADENAFVSSDEVEMTSEDFDLQGSVIMPSTSSDLS